MFRKAVTVGGLLVAVAFAVVATSSSAEAVPAFARQTGLTCNQCHTGISPVPDFTFTGTRFRLLGYRYPVVTETMEAGEEGALSGQRLKLALHNYTSIHVRSQFFTQSKPASPPGGSSEWSTLQSDPIYTIGWYFVGPISDHFGIWNEFYTWDFVNNQKQHGGFFSLAEWDFKWSTVVGDNNIIGLSANTNQQLGAVFGFGPFDADVGALSIYNTYVAGTGTPKAHMNFMAYGLFDDRLSAAVGVEPGEDNFDFDRQNWKALLGYAFSNTDAEQIWLYGEFMAGNDAMPLVTGYFWDWKKDGGPGYTYYSRIQGVEDLRLPSSVGTAYRPRDVGDVFRAKTEFRYGFTDRGNHTLNTVLGFGTIDENYADGAEYNRTSAAVTVRYYWDRTWGTNFQIGTDLSQEFVDPGGTVHDVPTDVFWEAMLGYRAAQNVELHLSFGNSQTRALDEDWNPGYSWQFRFHWLM